MRIGMGCYVEANADEVASTQADFYLVMNNGGCVTRLRQLLGVDPVIVWRDVRAEPNMAQNPVSEAQRLINIIVSDMPPGCDAVVGANEYMGNPPNLAWAIPFEQELTRQAHARNLGYVAGSIATGNLEANEAVQLIAALVAPSVNVDALCYHAYIEPGRTDLEPPDRPWWFWRPLRLWKPACDAAGIRFPLIIGGEAGRDNPGPLPPAATAGLLQQCVAPGTPYGMLACYGFGLVGNQQQFRLDGTAFVPAAGQYNAGQARTARQAWNDRFGGPPPPPPPPQYVRVIASPYANIRSEPRIAPETDRGDAYRNSVLPVERKEGRWYKIATPLWIHDSVVTPIRAAPSMPRQGAPLADVAPSQRGSLDVDPVVYAQRRRPDLGKSAASGGRGKSGARAYIRKFKRVAFQIDPDRPLWEQLLPGDALVWDAGVRGASEHGHVAIVEEVSQPDEAGKEHVVVSESNWRPGTGLNRRTLDKDDLADIWVIP